MKVGTLVIAALTIIAGYGQTGSSGEAGLKIIRVELQHTIARSPSLRAVAATDPNSQKQAVADRNANIDSDPALHRMSQNAEIAPKTSSQDPLGNMPVPDRVVFTATVLVKNIGTKTVTAVQWEYLLFEKDAIQPIKRYRVETKKVIGPNEEAELTKEVNPKGQEQQARLIRIDYSDGTFWQQK